METIKKKVKKPSIEVIYNKRNITQEISKFVMSLSYTDFEKDQADELNLVLKDSDDRFKDSWKPSKGDKIQAKIFYTGEPVLNCGVFTVDENTLDSSDDGDTCTIKALATSITQALKEVNNKPYESKTLVQIAQEIGDKHGFTVAGSEGNIRVGRQTQYQESDLGFLRRISDMYGYIFKITDTVLTFEKLENLEAAEPLSTITKKDIMRLTLNDTSAKTYSSCRVEYQSPKTGKLTSYTARSGKEGVKNDVLKLDTKCDSRQQAISVANAGLKNGQNTIEGSVNLSNGNPYFIAGCNFKLNGYKKWDGKYHISQSTHIVNSDDWTVNGEVRRVA